MYKVILSRYFSIKVVHKHFFCFWELKKYKQFHVKKKKTHHSKTKYINFIENLKYILMNNCSDNTLIL